MINRSYVFDHPTELIASIIIQICSSIFAQPVQRNMVHDPWREWRDGDQFWAPPRPNQLMLVASVSYLKLC